MIGAALTEGSFHGAPWRSPQVLLPLSLLGAVWIIGATVVLKELPNEWLSPAAKTTAWKVTALGGFLAINFVVQVRPGDSC